MLRKAGEIEKAEKIVQDAFQIDRNHVEFLSYFNSFWHKAERNQINQGLQWLMYLVGY